MLRADLLRSLGNMTNAQLHELNQRIGVPGPVHA